MAIPADLKYIAPYIQRVPELIERDPVIAYYAQYYAAKLAISRGPSNKEVNSYLSHLLDNLEKMKADLGPNEAITNDDVGYAYIENFALKVFLNADNEDRAGKASRKTAKTFLAASIFLELLRTFGDLDPEIEVKIKYSKWKATDIIKALKEGRAPTPGAPGESEAAACGDDFPEDMPTQPPSSISEFPSPPSNFTASTNSMSSTPAADPSQPTFSHPPQTPATPSTPPNPPTTASPPVTPSQSASRSVAPVAHPPTYYQPPATTPVVTLSNTTPSQPATIIDPEAITSSQKHAKWAISALNYDDIKSARTNLLAALNDLGFNQSNNFGY
ncbi:hypothetical protein BX666DRAFT_1865814 [Dichotomocladium elegans]|nr:hypothetical protein BX666DRAFT_1865814 [Dichotomocladium elegans]